ncbi:ubiquitin-related modifier 1 [Tetranychus urticae]|uniref:Ubiquitin-related modifier 1 homolog n=1 Tax=Tetranychus urticae TaxID=32264 RepID=T1L3S0_TETUR|nr:ubiquitin-related modifier 1 [Tetranychus urticae]
MSNHLNIIVEFKGGMELLFDNVTKKELSLPVNSGEDGSAPVEWTIKDLINHLKEKHLKERPELFVNDDSIRPGVLILVNDVDWEILGENEYKLADGDKVLFISTLHGG